MKTKTIFKRKVNLGLLFSAVIFTSIVGCQKGTFSVNDVNPNSPTAAPAKYTLSSALSGTANLVQGGNADVLENWMGYWTQSGGYTPSTTFVIYQITSSNYTGNFDNAYLNLVNYNLLIKTAGADPLQSNFKAIGMIMESYVYQRLVDLYNNVPYSQALSANATFSYKYDDPQAIYKALIAKCDSAVAILDVNIKPGASAVVPDNYDIVFQGDMTKWRQFANTLKLKLLMRETAKGTDSKASLATTVAADYLTVDAAANPGYSNASDGQLNPFYFDVVANSQGSNGQNTPYWRANSYAVDFYHAHNDPRVNYIYAPSGKDAVKYTAPDETATVKGRVYGSTNGLESNTIISAVLGTGFTSAGAQKGPSQASVLLPASESLFLQAEAAQRGYITYSTAAALYQAAVTESFRFLGVIDYAAKATAYTAQADQLTKFSASTDKLNTILTQKWAAMNSVDPLESYSDWRRTGIPTTLPVSAYPGVTVTHIPWRFPYPVNETTLNSANVPSGGSASDLFTSKIFWMP